MLSTDYWFTSAPETDMKVTGSPVRPIQEFTMEYEFALWTKGKKGWRREEYTIVEASTYEEACDKLKVYATEIYGCWIPLRACLRTGIESFEINEEYPLVPF